MSRKDDLQQQIEETNIAEHLDETVLHDMGQKVVQWFDEDEASRKEWKDRNEMYMKLATQVVEKKTYPWPDSANVKFPLLTTAAMQFAARAYPTLVPGPNLVQGLVVGQDPDGQKGLAAKRIGQHMSYQILWEMEDWEEDMDKLCLMLPIVGCAFKKTYYDEFKGVNCSHLINPYDFVVDYYARSLESATRKSHVFHRNHNEIEERVRKGIYLEVDLSRPIGRDETKQSARNRIDGTQEPADTPATPYKLIEMHTFWDLDDDGYDEPYIITVEYFSQKVLRVKTRYRPEDIELDAKDNVISIKPIEYFTKFGFIPNPDGGFYDLGFGLLLGGINETVNTLTNQLLDSGTLRNLQGGFLGRGIRVRGGQTRFSPGEWKPVDFSGDDIKKHIFPIPTNEPSEVLFKLLETLVVSGKELASIAEIFVGKMPGQNTPATTTMASIEQGLKVLTAIIKRIYRSLQKEYALLFRLNSVYMDEQVYFTVNALQGPQAQQAYKSDYDPKTVKVKPFADPNIVSASQKLMKVQSMMPLLQLQTINPQIFTQQYLEAIEAENIPQLMQVQPQPNPEMAKIAAESQAKQQEYNLKAQVEMMKAQHEKESHAMDMRMKAMELQFKGQEAMMNLKTKAASTQMDLAAQKATTEQDLQLGAKQHEQKMEQGAAQHEAKMAQTKEAAKAKPVNGK